MFNIFIAFIYYIWQTISGVYSAMQLTKPTDRLPALSGIATKYHESTGSRYLAGMWERDLLPQLCWQATTLATESQRLTYPYHQYLSPSWSWVSISQPVIYNMNYLQSRIEPGVVVSDVQCEVPGLNPFGQVTKGHLRLRGKITQICLDCDDPLRPWGYVVKNRSDWEFIPDCILREEGDNIVRASEGQISSVFSANATCIFIGGQKVKQNMEGENMSFALVLGRSNIDGDIFHRIGLLISRDEDGFGCLFKVALNREVYII